MPQIAVIDYGGSNLRSVAKALEYVAAGEHEIVVSNERDTILNAHGVVFPGQGAIGDCMNSLTDNQLVEVITECLTNRPFLGICLGLQSLMTHSDEDGGTKCLDRFAGEVKHFRENAGPAADGTPRKIPHMGWNKVHWQKEHALVAGIDSGTRFYFVHSYCVVPNDRSIVMAQTDYIDTFVSAIAAGNAFATQFHPEKSADAGLRLLANFLKWDGR